MDGNLPSESECAEGSGLEIEPSSVEVLWHFVARYGGVFVKRCIPAASDVIM